MQLGYILLNERKYGRNLIGPMIVFVINWKNKVIMTTLERVLAVAERYGMEPNEVLDNIGKLFRRLFL